MNEELIRKLHDQAWGETHEKAIAVTETPIDFQKVLRERFAELIVSECADIADRRPNVLINQTVGGWIKQHFGVES
jgi:hypothetical protein